MPCRENDAVNRPLLPLVFALALAVSGCASLNSDYQRPATQLPTNWQQLAESQAGANPDWWKAFGDPTLDRLVDEVLARNNSLGNALLAVRRARLQTGLARDAQWPQASAGLSADRTRALRGEGSTSHSYSLTGSLGWEVDLWNRLGSATDAAELETLATAEDHAATRLALIGTVAEFYWQLAYLNERLAASAASIDYARQTLALVQTQYDAGQSSALELAEARQSLETQLAADVALRQEQVEQRNALAVLYDGQPPVFDEPGRLRDAALPPVAADLPASLLGRRPDLRASELRLRASLKNVDATRASYYPDLSLTGTLGYSSAALGNLLQNPVGALGAGLTLPFLQWNQMQLQVDTARTDYSIAANDFRQGLYEALAEVENSLAGRRHFAEQEANRQRALDAAREAERIYQVRYESGAESLQSWITAQQTRRNAEITLAENRLNQLLNHISLAQALGGGAEQPADAEALLSDSRVASER